VSETPAGRLILVPTPIGNLEDITLRALRVLEEADVVAAEDTRHSGRLLAHFEIKARLLAFHEHNEKRQLPNLLALLADGKRVALISDAGTPGLSDPGFTAVRAAVNAGFTVEALPGPTALVPALVGSGLPCDRFAFEGYVPRKTGARRRAFEALAHEDRTVVFYESPHRLAKSLAILAEVLPERPVVLARELSKLHERFQRGTATALGKVVAEHGAKGECVLLIGGRDAPRAAPPPS
jgi:16S rRNA (cytidine1402-2'-O)-methyltransferase